MDVFEAMRTTRAMRRLDNDKPVSDDDIWTIVEYATKAATGGNSQPVRWIVVRDAEKRKRLGDIYRECWAQVGAMYRQRTPADDTQTNRILTSADHLGEHMGEAPVIIIPASKGGDPGSVYPGVQNLFLAARALGLGTTLTTVHKLKEAEVRQVLDLPEDVQTWAMIPVGYPTGKWGEAKRRPVEEVTYWDGWRQTRTR
ncbi:MAG TPA: nitroreductase family protein [Actinomycetota bacterium]|jgi:nitroreductase|nr:nitroreductase family protein [Actinomycetota bacterium]HVM06950.1 nitroreductase family protein [Acidimicrobiales bacterium]